jgi:aromatic ring-opening dioxygenase catalytic subunit (LigB family)
VSAHWEEPKPTVLESARPELYFDYSGFPPHTYELTWPVPGNPALAARVRTLLGEAGFDTGGNASRGLDHGVFVPLKLSVPEADIPVVQLSLVRGLDPEAHLAMGRALRPLRDEGVLIVGSGMSFHDLRALFGGGGLERSRVFDRWLEETLPSPEGRNESLRSWEQAPEARASHPREEHLLPLMVVAGAAEGEGGEKVLTDEVMDAQVSAYRFG